MSWQRRNWEKKNRNKISLQKNPSKELWTEHGLFPVLRSVDKKTEAALGSLLLSAAENLAVKNGKKQIAVFSRELEDTRPSILTVGIREQKAFASHLHSYDPDIFLAELAERSKTSHQEINAKIIGCGLFGRRNYHGAKFGLVFDKDTSDLLLHERSVALTLLGATALHDKKTYPHLTIGIAQVDQSNVLALKKEISGIIDDLSDPVILPTVPSYQPNDLFVC